MSQIPDSSDMRDPEIVDLEPVSGVSDTAKVIMGFAAFWAALIGGGLLQWKLGMVTVLPAQITVWGLIGLAVVTAVRRDWKPFAKGMLIGAMTISGLVFLLVGACFAIVIYSAR